MQNNKSLIMPLIVLTAVCTVKGASEEEKREGTKRANQSWLMRMLWRCCTSIERNPYVAPPAENEIFSDNAPVLVSNPQEQGRIFITTMPVATIPVKPDENELYKGSSIGKNSVKSKNSVNMQSPVKDDVDYYSVDLNSHASDSSVKSMDVLVHGLKNKSFVDDVGKYRVIGSRKNSLSEAKNE